MISFIKPMIDYELWQIPNSSKYGIGKKIDFKKLPYL